MFRSGNPDLCIIGQLRKNEYDAKTFLPVLRLSENCGQCATARPGVIRVAILIIFVWIGGLKFWNYEAEGIVPFVANSPFMSFFYNEKAPEYRVINSRRANTTLKNMRGTSRTTPMAFPTGWGCLSWESAS